MILTLEQAKELCKNPKNRPLIERGKKLESKHQLHIEGREALLKAFLTKHTQFESEETFNSRIGVSKAATKPVYAQIRNCLDKIFTAHGSSFYYEFKSEGLQDEFEEYLTEGYKQIKGQTFYDHIEHLYKRHSLTGFQGLFLVDLPRELSDNIEPYLVYVSSSQVHDVEITANRVEYVIIYERRKNNTGESEDHYVVIDDVGYFLLKKNQDRYDLETPQILHNLNYVPACPVTEFTEISSNSITRTSIVGPSLEIADTFLRDDSEHELNKLIHMFMQKWSFAVPCDYVHPESQYPCNGAGVIMYSDNAGEHKLQCPRCKGKGSYIPTGPDLVYRMPVPESKEQFIDLRDPAGYISMDVEPVRYIREELIRNEAKIEKAVLGKEGILQQAISDTATGKMIDMEPVFDLLKKYKSDLERIHSFVVETFARIKYEANFISAQVRYGDRFFLKSVSQLETEYGLAKAAGLPDNMLFSLLEDLIYTKYRENDRELNYNLIKLYLTPFPTQTLAEVQAFQFVPTEDMMMRLYLNEYIQRFEIENGNIVDFGSLLPFGAKINRIRERLRDYNAEKVALSKPITPSQPPQPQPLPEPITA